ncbi:MAG: PIN domain nuclease [Truepera sp.]|nr:PIN domain nuclease [Truepera sp.]
MKRVLVDTSAWVEKASPDNFDRATGSSADARLTALIASDLVAVTEPVIMEVLAGARNDQRERDLRRLLLRFERIPFDATTDFDGAVRIYRTCRAQGITPRGLVDCMIASVVIRAEATLLAFDRDLAAIAAVMHLHLDEASLSA